MRRYALLLAAIAAIAAIAGNAHAESELVIAIRYLHAQGTSHSHLYLYREDGKLLRQLTNDDSGQDSGPIFSPDGETIVFTRERRIGTRRRKARRISQTSNHKKQDRQMRQVHLRSRRHRAQLRFRLTNRQMVRSN